MPLLIIVETKLLRRVTSKAIRDANMLQTLVSADLNSLSKLVLAETKLFGRNASIAIYRADVLDSLHFGFNVNGGRLERHLVASDGDLGTYVSYWSCCPWKDHLSARLDFGKDED